MLHLSSLSRLPSAAVTRTRAALCSLHPAALLLSCASATALSHRSLTSHTLTPTTTTTPHTHPSAARHTLPASPSTHVSRSAPLLAAVHHYCRSFATRARSSTSTSSSSTPFTTSRTRKSSRHPSSTSFAGANKHNSSNARARKTTSAQKSTTHKEKKERLAERAAEAHKFNPYEFKVAIFGRPNVGKSTLFNRLVGKHVAIVDKTPGVTRDRRDSPATLADLEFTLIDTAGLEEIQTFLDTKPESETQHTHHKRPLSTELQAGILEQTRLALLECDVAMFVIDGRIGITPLDIYFAKWMRKQLKSRLADNNRAPPPILLLVNKVDHDDRPEDYPGMNDAYELGFGEPFPLSAEHGEGLAGLHTALNTHFQNLLPTKQAEKDQRDVQRAADLAAGVESISVAIVGKPNTGKSTLVNAMLGEQRMLVGAQPGVTRDSISSEWNDPVNDPKHKITLIDTAGLKGTSIFLQSQRYTRVDALAMSNSIRTIEQAHVVLLTIDVTNGLAAPTTTPGKRYTKEDEAKLQLQRVHGVLSTHDLAIAKRVVDEGRALVILANKWDSIPMNERDGIMLGLTELLQLVLPQTKGCSIVPLSGLTGFNLATLRPAIVKAYHQWDTRVGTHKLNTWLRALQTYKPPPAIKGKPIKLKYVTQIHARPPTFAVFVSRATNLPDDYERFLMNSIREEFNLQGTPVRMYIRTPNNPYANGGVGGKDAESVTRAAGGVTKRVITPRRLKSSSSKSSSGAADREAAAEMDEEEEEGKKQTKRGTPTLVAEDEIDEYENAQSSIHEHDDSTASSTSRVSPSRQRFLARTAPPSPSPSAIPPVFRSRKWTPVQPSNTYSGPQRSSKRTPNSKPKIRTSHTWNERRALQQTKQAKRGERGGGKDKKEELRMDDRRIRRTIGKGKVKPMNTKRTTTQRQRARAQSKK